MAVSCSQFGDLLSESSQIGGVADVENNRMVETNTVASKAGLPVTSALLLENDDAENQYTT